MPPAKAAPQKVSKECPYGGPQPVEREVLGNERALRLLRDAARKGACAGMGDLPEGEGTPQAWLFSGPDSVGKHTAAWWFVRVLLCEAQDFEVRPCNECSTCRRLLHSSVTGGCRGEEDPEKWCDACREVGTVSPHPHVRELEVEPGKTQITADQVREVLEWAAFPPLEGEDGVLPLDPARPRRLHKVVIIPQAQRLNDSTQNLLLKTLEEPPAHLVFLLITPTHTALLPTIISRTTQVRLSPVPEHRIVEWLQGQAGLDRVPLAAALCEGCPGVALSRAREAGAKGRRKGFWDLRDRVLDVAAALPGMDGLGAMERAEELLPAAVRTGGKSKAGEGKLLEAERVIDILATWFRDLLILAEGLEGQRSLLNRDRVDALRSSVGAWTPASLLSALDALRGYRLMIRGNVNQKLLFPRLLLQFRGHHTN